MCKDSLTEVWKDISGYEGLYQVSNFGRVKSLDRYIHFNDGRIVKRSGNILKVSANRYGYAVVWLSKDCVEKACTVHRLVAEAFLPNPNSLPQVNHKDEDKANNNLDNLEWCDMKYNLNYGTCQSRRIDKLLNYDKTSKPVEQYTMDMVLVNTYPSASEAGRKTGYDNSHISQCCNGKLKQAYGYIWKYVQG